MNQKLAIVLPFERKGGLERMASVLAAYLADNGYDVFFIMTKKCEELYEEKQSIHYYVLPHKAEKNIVFRIIEKLFTLRKIIKANEIRTVISFGHIATMFVVPALFGMKIKHIATLRIDPSKEPTNKFLRKVRDISYNFVDTIVFQTEDAKKYFKPSIQKKGVVIPNPISDGLPEPFKGERRKEIVNFCRLTEQKNLPLLIDAFAEFRKKHNDYSLVIYGKGELKEQLLNQIEELGLNGCAEIRDFSPNIHQLILDSAMFVSTSDYEGISNSMLEAMAIGLPVICTDCPVGGARMIIRNNENGILTPVGDKTAITNAMCFIAEHSEKANLMSKSGLSIRDEFALDNILLKWVEII